MKDKGIAFVIMQIGNPELDKLYEEVYIPAIEDAQLIPKRVDKDNSGQLLKSEIITFIETAEIIIADLTHERPNCYLEVGYVMGLDKFHNLIFTVREDHFPESENFQKGGHKIHFDVSGYEILGWDKNKLAEFQKSLTNKINRRLTTIRPKTDKGTLNFKPLWDSDWLKEKRDYVNLKLSEMGISRKMEILVSVENTRITQSQSKILEIANECQSDILGWPIAPIAPYVPEFRPKPQTDGLFSEISRDTYGQISYDYTYYKKNGNLFISKSLFEEHGFKKSIIVPFRIKKSTELLLYILRYYYKFGLTPTDEVNIEVRYSGLINNELTYASEGFIRGTYKSRENESYCKLKTTLGNIENNLNDLVNQLTNELFVLFDFYNVEKGRIDFYVNEIETKMNNARR